MINGLRYAFLVFKRQELKLNFTGIRIISYR